MPVFRVVVSSFGGIVVVGGALMKPAACDDATDFLGDAGKRGKNKSIGSGGAT